MNRDEVMTFVKKSLKFLPDKSYIKLYYRLRVGRKLNTDNGDYMKLPPEDQRINHGIKAWRELPNEK